MLADLAISILILLFSDKFLLLDHHDFLFMVILFCFILFNLDNILYINFFYLYLMPVDDYDSSHLIF